MDSLILEINRQIEIFTTQLGNGSLPEKVVNYYQSLKNLVLYVDSKRPNFEGIDEDYLQSQKTKIRNEMSEILDIAYNQNDNIYLEACDMMKEMYEYIDMLCNALTS